MVLLRYQRKGLPSPWNALSLRAYAAGDALDYVFGRMEQIIGC